MQIKCDLTRRLFILLLGRSSDCYIETSTSVEGIDRLRGQIDVGAVIFTCLSACLDSCGSIVPKYLVIENVSSLFEVPPLERMYCASDSIPEP
jgi:hypothetical protein